MTMAATTLPPEITFRIRRFDPTADAAPHWDDFSLPYSVGMTVLDGLKLIKESRSASLAWRSSCRMGVCGSCGMFINGRPRLACNTQITELGTSLVTVAPLPNFDIVRDLVPDLSPMFDAHVALMPYIIRDDAAELQEPSGEFWQSIEEVEHYLQFSYCIKCCLPHLRDRPDLLGADAPGAVAPLQCRLARRWVPHPQEGTGWGERSLEMSLRRRVLARMPEGRGPGQGDSADEAGLGARLPEAPQEGMPGAHRHATSWPASRRDSGRACPDREPAIVSVAAPASGEIGTGPVLW
jgi:succinate dehydrogenase/fumarate reductase iron-sulfur protein